MKNTNAVRTEIHYAQVGEYQLPLLTLPQTDDTELLLSLIHICWWFPGPVQEHTLSTWFNDLRFAQGRFYRSRVAMTSTPVPQTSVCLLYTSRCV